MAFSRRFRRGFKGRKRSYRRSRRAGYKIRRARFGRMFRRKRTSFRSRLARRFRSKRRLLRRGLKTPRPTVHTFVNRTHLTGAEFVSRQIAGSMTQLSTILGLSGSGATETEFRLIPFDLLGDSNAMLQRYANTYTHFKVNWIQIQFIPSQPKPRLTANVVEGDGDVETIHYPEKILVTWPMYGPGTWSWKYPINATGGAEYSRAVEAASTVYRDSYRPFTLKWSPRVIKHQNAAYAVRNDDSDPNGAALMTIQPKLAKFPWTPFVDIVPTTTGVAYDTTGLRTIMSQPALAMMETDGSQSTVASRQRWWINIKSSWSFRGHRPDSHRIASQFNEATASVTL